MKISIGKWLPVLAAAVVAASFVIVSDVEAARGGGGGARGGGGGGGGGARAGGGSGQRQAAQVNNGRADARTSNVRSTSVNNVNVERNVNVNVDNGWDNDYHPVARAAVVGAAVAVTSAAIGSMVATVPPSCVPVNYGGMVYQQCGSTWYQPQGPQFVVVNAPY